MLSPIVPSRTYSGCRQCMKGSNGLLGSQFRPQGTPRSDRVGPEAVHAHHQRGEGSQDRRLFLPTNGCLRLVSLGPSQDLGDRFPPPAGNRFTCRTNVEGPAGYLRLVFLGPVRPILVIPVDIPLLYKLLLNAGQQFALDRLLVKHLPRTDLVEEQRAWFRL